jgi:hypothetical protein
LSSTPTQSFTLVVIAFTSTADGCAIEIHGHRLTLLLEDPSCAAQRHVRGVVEGEPLDGVQDCLLDSGEDDTCPNPIRWIERAAPGDANRFMVSAHDLFSSVLGSSNPSQSFKRFLKIKKSGQSFVYQNYHFGEQGKKEEPVVNAPNAVVILVYGNSKVGREGHRRRRVSH